MSDYNSNHDEINNNNQNDTNNNSTNNAGTNKTLATGAAALVSVIALPVALLASLLISRGRKH